MPESAKSTALVKLDPTDRKLLRLLQENAKYTIRELAERLHLTSTPVHERIRRLEKSGVISGYSAIIDRKKVGKPMIVFCGVRLRKHTRPALKAFRQEVLELRQVTESYHVSGEYDYLLKVFVEDIDEYQEFITEKLSDLDNIGSVQSFFVLEELKWGLDFLG